MPISLSSDAKLEAWDFNKVIMSLIIIYFEIIQGNSRTFKACADPVVR